MTDSTAGACGVSSAGELYLAGWSVKEPVTENGSTMLANISVTDWMNRLNLVFASVSKEKKQKMALLSPLTERSSSALESELSIGHLQHNK